MATGSRHFANTTCEYYPCHEMMAGAEINCLFCYCPLYWEAACPGEPRTVLIEGIGVRDCSSCKVPHEPEHYPEIIQLVRERIMNPGGLR